ncbi:MAG: hypothetical protein JJU28_05975 [Cyclobacteriaceae bacterium]|nr:hypothetical protein [Cyclobacteriaceae bacterium]
MNWEELDNNDLEILNYFAKVFYAAFKDYGSKSKESLTILLTSFDSENQIEYYIDIFLKANFIELKNKSSDTYSVSKNAKEYFHSFYDNDKNYNQIFSSFLVWFKNKTVAESEKINRLRLSLNDNIKTGGAIAAVIIALGSFFWTICSDLKNPNKQEFELLKLDIQKSLDSLSMASDLKIKELESRIDSQAFDRNEKEVK